MDISHLPPDVQQAARIDANGEVSWPERETVKAIEALAAAGHRILGLDVQFYAEDGTHLEIAYNDSGGKSGALEALSRLDELAGPEDETERWVLVTWD